jgi:cell division protein FtsA
MAVVSKKERLICGLDVGSSKICMVIARPIANGRLEIVNTGYAPSVGLVKGVIVDLEGAAEAIRKAASEAEVKSGISIDWVTLGISGEHLQSYNCHGAVSIEGKRREVSAEHMSQVIKAAQSIPIPANREIIHILPQEFILDGRGDIKSPVGLTGSRLDVKVHIVTCESTQMQNLIAAVNKAQMRVKRVSLQQLASGEAVLTRDERELGVAVIDIGGSTTDMAIYLRNGVFYSSVLPVGGAHFTRDLAVALRTPIEEAETLKKLHGSVQLETIANDESVEVRRIGATESILVPRSLAAGYLRDRAVELLELIRERLMAAEISGQIMAGSVITGGGSMLPGVVELAEDILQMPVRRGIPTGVQGLTGDLLHPVYATAVGLVLLAAQDGVERNVNGGKPVASPRLVGRLLSWMGNQE